MMSIAIADLPDRRFHHKVADSAKRCVRTRYRFA
jgi:hypothetical protein